MSDKSIRELEDDYVSIVLGREDVWKADIRGIDNEKARQLVDYYFEHKKIIDNFQGKVKIAWNLYYSSSEYRVYFIDSGGEESPFLRYYKERLVSEIRDLKIKNIL
jgi:hypothetical protein